MIAVIGDFVAPHRNAMDPERLEVEDFEFEQVNRAISAPSANSKSEDRSYTENA